MPALLAFVTCPTAEVAAGIAKTLVEERLAACGNLVPGLRSIYSWEGKLCDESEVLLLIKTTGEAFGRLQARVVELHPYDLPEVIAVKVEAGLPAYLQWVADSVK